MTDQEPAERAEETSNWPAPLEADEVEEAVVISREGQPLGTFTEIAATYFRGPLPPPGALRDYNDIIPGLGERIVTNWEEESRHRRSLERQTITAGIRNQSRGQLIAAAIAIIVSFGGIALIATGNSVAGLIALLPNLIALVGLFIYRTTEG